MSKIICDICGTTYQDTAGCCPICGYTKEEAAALVSDEMNLDELLSEPTPRDFRPASPKKKKEIFDFDEANGGRGFQPQTVETEEDTYGDDDGEEEPRSQNTFVIVLLTLLIVALLGAAAFLFLRFYLPGMGAEETTIPTTMATEAPTTVPTTELSIACDGLVLVSGTASGDAELVSAGQKFLLNVIATPENTTDVITYASADESIATVNADGQVVAVGEGETIITITCGAYQIPCKVVCNFAKETEPPTEATTEATEAPTVVTEAPLKNVTLKLNKTDFRLQVPYYTTGLQLDCDLDPSEVEWSSENPHIATVDATGKVTAVKSGITSITVKYGDQTVSCLVRCYG